MVLLKGLLRLRLAARTLIEWKTPITAAEYQRVLSDLLKTHPKSSSWGLTLDKEFLNLDDRGVVLWYLSETINTEEPKEKLNLVDIDPNRHIILLMSNLMDYGTSIQEGEETFEGAYRRSQVADTIFEAIKSKDKL